MATVFKCFVAFSILQMAAATGGLTAEQVVPKWFVDETSRPTHSVDGVELRFKIAAPSFSHGGELPARLDLAATRQTAGSGAWEYVEYLRWACVAVLPETLAEPPAASVDLPPKQQFHLFLLVGQSNMAGRGKLSPQDQQPHPRVLMLDKEERWKPAVAPLHFDKPAVAGVGLGRSFGIEIAEHDPNITVGLIPCAAGGSPISSWEPGGYHGQTKSHPWDDAIRRARVALRSGQLKGILWHQGESDSHAGKAELYEAKLQALVNRFRKELNAPAVPFLVGQLGQFAERPWDESRRIVDRAHRQLPDKVPHTAFVESTGLKHKGDQVHFDAESYREFGRRYARAYRKLGD